MGEGHGNVWKCIRRRPRHKDNIPTLKTNNDENLIPTQDKTDTFATFFEQQHRITQHKSDSQIRFAV